MVIKFQTVLFLIIINISTVLINKKNLHFNVKNYFLIFENMADKEKHLTNVILSFFQSVSSVESV